MGSTSTIAVHVAPSRVSSLTHSFIVVATILALFAIHPDWYGDAVWYAKDLVLGSLWNDPGHLIWRPLGSALWQSLLPFIPDLDPIISLQILSSLGTAALVLGSYHLTLTISHSRTSACLVAILIACSSFSILYGASGSSYPAAAACVTWAVHLSLKQNRSAPILFTGAVLIWAPSILALPGFFLAPLLLPKSQLAIMSCWRSICIIAALLSAIFGLTFLLSGQDHFSSWALTSSHGIPISFSILSVAKATIGFISSILFTDSFGTAIKALLLEDPALSQVPLHRSVVIALTIFCLSMTAAVISLWINKSLRKIALLWAVAILPFAVFAVLWQGSDIERFSPVLALSALVVVLGMRQLSSTITAMLITLLALNNILSIHPSLNERGRLPSLIGSAAKGHLKPNSLLITAGQRLSPHIWAPIDYFYGIHPYSISFDVQSNGPRSWRANLASAISEAQRHGGEIAVLSDFKGTQTPGGIWLSERELPSPTIKDIQSYFEDWQAREIWSIGDFTFVTIEPKL